MSEEIDVEVDWVVTFSLWGRLFGSETRNEFAYIQTAPEDVSLLAGYCGFFEQQKMPVIQGLSSPDMHYYNLRADVWSPVVDGYTSVGWRDYPLNLFGTTGMAGDTHPANCALVMRRRVGPAGRSNRGRVYICGVPRTFGPQGILGGSSFIDKTNNFKVEMARTLNDASDPTPLPLADPVLIHRGPTGLVVSEKKVSHWDPNTILRSQRRREFGVGL